MKYDTIPSLKRGALDKIVKLDIIHTIDIQNVILNMIPIFLGI